MAEENIQEWTPSNSDSSESIKEWKPPEWTPPKKLEKIGEAITRMYNKDPEKEPSLFPPIKQPETYWGGFSKSLYDQFVRPMGTVPGIAENIAFGAADGITPKEIGEALNPNIIDVKNFKSEAVPEMPIRREGIIPPERQLGAATRSSTEIPYKLDNELPIRPSIRQDITPSGPIEQKLPEQVNLPAEFSDVGEEDLFNKNQPDKGLQRNIEDTIYENAKRKLGGLQEALPEETITENTKPTAKYLGEQEKVDGSTMSLYNIEGGLLDKSTVGENKLKELGIDIPEKIILEKIIPEVITPKKELVNPFKKSEVLDEWKPEVVQKGEIQLGDNSSKTINIQNPEKTPEALHPALTGLKNYGDGVLYTDFDKSAGMTPEKVKELFPNHNVSITQLHTDSSLPDRFRVDVSGKDDIEREMNGNDIENSVGGSFDKNEKSLTQRLSGEAGMAKIRNVKQEPATGPYGAALDKLFNSLGNAMESRVSQDLINKTERAKRFANSANAQGEGIDWAKKALSAMRGEFEKADVGKLGLNEQETNTLFNAVKKANITQPEKLRGVSALFKLMNGNEPLQRNELQLLNDVFGNNFAARIIDMHGGIGAIGLPIGKLGNTMKAMSYSSDLSFPLRQGIGFALTPEWRNAVKEQLKYFAKPEYFKEAMDAIKSDPDYLLSRDAGLFLSEPGGLLDGEEAFMNSYVSAIPRGAKGLFQRDLVDASERAYTGGLNKLRMDTFKNLTNIVNKTDKPAFTVEHFVNIDDMNKVKDLQKLAKEQGISSNITSSSFIDFAKKNRLTKATKVTTKTSEDIAKVINVFTGRGSLGKLEGVAPLLNDIFGSPRFISSRLTALNPKFYADLDPFARKEAIKALFRMAATSNVLNGLGALAGGTIGYNILNSDFMKTRFKSNNVLDPSGGFQQPIVLAARLIGVLSKYAQGKKLGYNESGIKELIENFVANKLSPLYSLGYDMSTAKQYTGNGNYTDRFGNTKTIQGEVARRFVSIFSQDMYQLMTSDPSFAESVGLPVLGVLGAGEQNYPQKKEKSSMHLRMR